MITPNAGPEAGESGERPGAKTSAASAGAQEIFAHAAPALRCAGFAVLPAHGKEPTRMGFTKWKHAPGLRTIVEWGEKDPTANIVYVPALCRTERGGDPIVVLDSDDAEAAEEVERRFGRTPGMVKTRRGRHALYRDGGAALGNLSSLKKFGLNADLKHGRSIVVAPPSIHPVSGTVYAWQDCDPNVIRHLPAFNARALQDLIDGGQKSQGADFHPSEISQGGNSPPNVTSTAPSPGDAEGLSYNLGSDNLREGSRGLGLNDLLCRHAWAVETRDELLDVARTINQDFPVPLEDSEVIERADDVWKDLEAGKLQRWLGREGNGHASKSEIKDLSQVKNGGDALMLLMLLRAEHTARVRRGETFALNCRAMAHCESLSWTVERFRNARDVLLRCGHIKVVAPGKYRGSGRTATQYTLELG